MKKKHVSCSNCKSLNTKRNGKRKISNRLVQRFYCFSCKKSFCLRHQKRSRISYHKQIKLTRQHLEGRTSIRTIARHSNHSTRTVVRAIHTITRQCVSTAWIAKELKPKWSGYLSIDGKMIRVWDKMAKHFKYTKTEKRWLHKMSLLIAMDLGTLDIPHHHLGSEETAIDLIMFLKQLKNIGYPLKGYVSDGNPDIPKAVKMVFGKDIPHQLCIRHYLQNLKKKLHEEKISHLQYEDSCKALCVGSKPRYMKVSKELFTYKKIKSLPTTNQQIENLIRYFNLRLKTIGQFQNWIYAKDYCNALTLMRRFIPFTDRKNQPNGKSPLELANCNIKHLDYLNLKSNR